MERAIAIALENVRNAKGGPFATIVVRNNEIISEGANSVAAGNDPTAHAEIVAIRRACAKLGTFQLTGCEIYASCEPCPMCLGAIYWARFDRLYYAASAADASRAGFDDSFIYSEILLPPDRRRLPAVRIMPQEALAPLIAWEKQPNKTPY